MTVMDKLTQTILQKLEEGVVPWHQPWKGGGFPGRNVLTNKPYRGFNWLVTTIAGYRSQYWLTFKQARSLGGTVKKGSKGTPIYFFKLLEGKDDPDTKFPLIRYFTIFNVLQCEFDDGQLPSYVTADIKRATDDTTIDESERIQRGDDIWENWEQKPHIEHGHTRACYIPKQDSIHMPMFEDFEAADKYYSVLFHEAVHSTGAIHRLNREGVADIKHNHSIERYGKEELVAEIGAARLCYEARIFDDTVDTNAAYIDHWMKAIKEKPSIIFTAANKADQAARYILGEDVSTSTK